MIELLEIACALVSIALLLVLQIRAILNGNYEEIKDNIEQDKR